MIRLVVPSIDTEDLEAVGAVLRSGFLVQGAVVRRFEERVAEIAGAPHVVAVSNGTAALHCALLALGVAPGDLVLVTAYSWISTANVVELCGAQPIFVDIDPRTFNMDPQALEAALGRLSATRDTLRRLRAILPIDAFGQMADLPEILKIAARHEVPVIEDAACALGAKLQGKPAGAWCPFTTFSFHPRKAVTTGEGGAIATADEDIAWKLRALRNHGLDPAASAPDFIAPGFNYRLTEFQAALGLRQLDKLERILVRRREAAAVYDKLMVETELSVPYVSVDSDPVYQSYVCLLPNQAAASRPRIIRTLKDKGVEATIGTWHMPLTTYFRARYGFRPGDFPATDEVFARTLSLPMHESLTNADQQYVVKSLLECL